MKKTQGLSGNIMNLKKALQRSEIKKKMEVRRRKKKKKAVTTTRCTWVAFLIT